MRGVKISIEMLRSGCGRDCFDTKDQGYKTMTCFDKKCQKSASAAFSTKILLQHCISRRWITSVVAALALLQGACGQADEPYLGASKQLPRLAPTLAELNKYGAIAFENQSFSYRLKNQCRLLIGSMFGGRQTADILIDLEVAQFERFDFANGLGFAVRLQNDSTRPDLYRSESPNDINHILDLLSSLQMNCRSGKSSREEATSSKR